MRYLRVDVYSCGMESTNHGVTDVHRDSLVVPCEEGNYTEEDVIEHGLVVLELQPSAMRGYPPKFVPVCVKGKWTMNGGNFVYTSDSRFGRKYGHQPIAVHDRVE